MTLSMRLEQRCAGSIVPDLFPMCLDESHQSTVRPLRASKLDIEFVKIEEVLERRTLFQLPEEAFLLVRLGVDDCGMLKKI